MRYRAHFHGRARGAIGMACAFSNIVVEADDEASARLKLYEDYEHIRELKLTPLDAAGSDDSREWLGIVQSEGRVVRPGEKMIPVVNHIVQGHEVAKIGERVMNLNLDLSALEHRLASQLVDRPSVGINIHTTDTGRTPTDLAYLDRAQEQVKALRNHPFLLKRRVKAGVAVLGNVTTAIANASGAIHRIAEAVNNANCSDQAQELWDEVATLNAAVEELTKLQKDLGNE